MLERYSKMLDAYKTWYPLMYSKTVECRPSGKYAITAILNDGSRVEFDSSNNTIRDVSKYYDHSNLDSMTEESWRQEFGRRLRRVMSEKNYTQERLSELTGISRQMLTRYVRGNSTPSGYVVNKLAEALDCDIRELTSFGYLED